MDAILTSFGIGMKRPESRCLLYRALPGLIHASGTGDLELDYAPFLLFDKVILDEQSYRQALDVTRMDDPDFPNDLRDVFRKAAEDYANFLKALEAAGRLIPRDFDETTRKTKSVWEAALAYDMKNLKEWREPLQASLEAWTTLIKQIREDPWRERAAKDGRAGPESATLPLLAHRLAQDVGMAQTCVETLAQWRKKQPEYAREMTRELLKDYLSYININLMLSVEYEATIIDWSDFHPFYAKKLQVAPITGTKGQRRAVESRKLFELMFPRFRPRAWETFANAIEDKRIDDLRSLIDRAALGKVTFDPEFAVKTFREVLDCERASGLRRKIVGWLTLPVSLVPSVGTPLAKGAQEFVDAIWSDRPRRKYGWFYLISELDYRPE